MNYESETKLKEGNVVSDFSVETTRNALLEAEAAFAQAKAQETNARNSLSYTVVKSPVNGVASMIPWHVGSLVSSSINEPLVTVADDREVQVYFSVTENYVLDLISRYGTIAEFIRQAPPVSLVLSNGVEYAHKGRIDAVNGIVESTTGAVTLRATFPNPEHMLHNGGTAKIIVPIHRKGCIVVPQESTYELQNRTFVYRVVDGKTKAIAVAISLFNALTLSPALCALIMTPHADTDTGGKLSFSSRFHIAFDAAFHRLVTRYQQIVQRFLRRRWLTVALMVVAIGGLGWFMKTTKTGLVPNEDMGTVFINVQASPGSTLKQTCGILKQVEERIKDLPQLRTYSLVAGTSIGFEQSASNGNFTLKLKKWDERKGKSDDVQSVMDEIYRRTADISNAKIQVNTQAMIPGFGRTNGFELYVQDKKGGTIEELLEYTNGLITALNTRPEISRAFTNFSLKYPQYRLEVDAALCKRRGVSPSDVLSALSGYIGGSYSSNFVRFTKLYRVMVQASPEYRIDTESLNNIFVKNDQGEMSPIGQYISLTRIYGSETLSRFNLFPSVSVSGTPADGYSTGQAIQAIREVAAQELPEGYGYEFGGMTREEASAENTTTMVFIICIVFIYLILCALYESLFIPMAVILSVPFGLAGSFIFANLWGLENNIYMQTGLIMLIGLLAKTAILLTEYASERRRQGMGIVEAALDAAAVRLRPVLMTSNDHDIRFVANGLGDRCRCQRKPFAWCGHYRWYVHWNHRLAFHCPGPFHCFSNDRGEVLPTFDRL